jgi:hypothetical protein
MIHLSLLTFDRFGASLFFVAVCFAACFMPAQNDTWWQLRAGKEILAAGSIPLQDSFSHTVAGGYWPDHEWLSQVIMYALYRAGGLPMLTAVMAALVAATAAMAWRLTPGVPGVRLALSLLALVPFAGEWSLRPQVFTLFLLAVTTLALQRGWHWVLPPFFLLWANLHGGVTLGIMVLTGYAVAATVSARRILLKPILVTALCAAMTGITPLGFSLWTEVPASLRRLRAYQVLEWAPPSISAPHFVTFWILVALFAAVVIGTKAWRLEAVRQDVRVWGALALFPVGFSASRNVPPLLVLLVPALGVLLKDRIRVRARVRRERPRLNLVILTVTIVLTAGATGYAWTNGVKQLQWRPLSDGAIAAVASCPERLYNRYDDGGYLIWFVPERKVFIDSRQDPYPPDLVKAHIRLESSGDYEETFNRYGIRCAFIPIRSVLAERLAAAHWSRLYQDSYWIVLAHP